MCPSASGLVWGSLGEGAGGRIWAPRAQGSHHTLSFLVRILSAAPHFLVPSENQAYLTTWAARVSNSYFHWGVGTPPWARAELGLLEARDDSSSGSGTTNHIQSQAE